MNCGGSPRKVTWALGPLEMEKIKATTDTIDTSTDLTVAFAFLGRCGKKWQPLVFK